MTPPAGGRCQGHPIPFRAAEVRHVRPLARTISVNANNRVGDRYPSTHDSAERDPTEIIAVVQVRHQHLEKWLWRERWRRHVFNNRVEQRCQVFIAVVQFAHREAVLRARVDDREIELLVTRLQLDE